MRIINTELDYGNTDEACLDVYLSESGENKDKWAQRVWDCCKRKSEDEDLPRVYNTKDGQTWQERAKELWENKKLRRRDAFVKLHGLKDASDVEIMKIKNSKKYKTRDERDKIETLRLIWQPVLKKRKVVNYLEEDDDLFVALVESQQDFKPDNLNFNP